MPVHDHWLHQSADGSRTYSWGWGPGHDSNVYVIGANVAQGTPSQNELMTKQNSWHVTNMSGNGQAHSIMPPYLSVYIWERKS